MALRTLVRLPRCRFGRLGFSAEEYVRLAYGRQSRVKIDNRGEIMEENRRLYWRRLPNRTKNVENNSRDNMFIREIREKL
jgi:hypothetical protein